MVFPKVLGSYRILINPKNILVFSIASSLKPLSSLKANMCMSVKFILLLPLIVIYVFGKEEHIAILGLPKK